MSHAGTRSRVLGAPFALLARARGSRPFHPQGLVAEATWEVTRAEPRAPQAAVLRPGLNLPALVRFSRGIGLPERFPDIYGIALRIPGADGSDGTQDLLFNTSVDAPLLHHLLLPARGWLSASYTTALPYRAGDGRLLVGLVPPSEPSPGPALGDLRERLRHGPLVFTIALASLTGRWGGVGTLTVHREVAGDVRFSPWNDQGGLIPSGALQRWRRAAYRASQEAVPSTVRGTGRPR